MLTYVSNVVGIARYSATPGAELIVYVQLVILKPVKHLPCKINGKPVTGVNTVCFHILAIFFRVILEIFSHPHRHLTSNVTCIMALIHEKR